MLDEVARLAQAAVASLMLEGAPRDDEYVLAKEFRVFLMFLQGYLDLWEIFGEVEKDERDMISLNEFILAAPKLKAWGFNDPALLQSPELVFSQIDEDESGAITFGEF